MGEHTRGYERAVRQRLDEGVLGARQAKVPGSGGWLDPKRRPDSGRERLSIAAIASHKPEPLKEDGRAVTRVMVVRKMSGFPRECRAVLPFQAVERVACPFGRLQVGRMIGDVEAMPAYRSDSSKAMDLAEGSGNVSSKVRSSLSATISSLQHHQHPPAGGVVIGTPQQDKDDSYSWRRTRQGRAQKSTPFRR